jgi:hypothetical protein
VRRHRDLEPAGPARSPGPRELAATVERGDRAGAELTAEAEGVALPIGAPGLPSLVLYARGTLELGYGRHAEAYEHLRRIHEPGDAIKLAGLPSTGPASDTADYLPPVLELSGSGVKMVPWLHGPQAVFRTRLVPMLVGPGLLLRSSGSGVACWSSGCWP